MQRLKQMRARVKEELEHMPDWPRPQQSELRMLFWSARMHSLGKKATEKRTALEVLQHCIATLGRDYPDFEFQYDESFFAGAG